MLKLLIRKAPWWAKIAAKVVLSRIPIAYERWSNFGLFRHGSNDEAAYGFRVFQQHFNFVQPAPGFVTLELGPGDALASAIIARAFGGSKSYQVDVSSFATRDVAIYLKQALYCHELGLATPDLTQATCLEEVLVACNATYLTDGLESLKVIPTASVDFVYSHSCLEHVRTAEFSDLMQELRRILKPSGGASHSVDFQDHLEGSLNNLRFASNIWESVLFAKSGFYTNRIRPTAMLDIMRKVGFSTKVVVHELWQTVPTPKEALHPDFRNLPDEELLTRRLVIVNE